MIQTCREKLASEMNPRKLEELVERQEKAAEMTRVALEDLKTHQTEIMKKMDEHRSFLVDLVHQQEVKAREPQIDEEEVTFDHHGEETEETEDKKYANKARKKAHEILTLMDTMPFRKLQDMDATPPAAVTETGESSFHGSVVTDTCSVCKKRDLGLMYCDTCEDLGGLYHAECLTLTDKATRSCGKCVEKSKSSSTSPSGPTEGYQKGGSNTMEDKEDKRTSKIPTKNTSKNEKGISPTSSSSSMSESSESSTSTSDSSVKPYSPRLRRALGETTLPALKSTTSKSSSKGTPQQDQISPLQTRGQRTAKHAKKTREDAFDTSEEEDSDK